VGWGPLKLNFLLVVSTLLSVLAVPGPADELRILKVEVFPPEANIRAFFPSAPGKGDGIPNGQEVSIPADALTVPLRITADGFESKETEISLLKATWHRPNYWLYRTSLRPDSPSGFLRSQWFHHPMRSAGAIVATLLGVGWFLFFVRRKVRRAQEETTAIQDAARVEVSKLKQKIVEGNLELEGDQIDDYSILETLGEGTYSRVYKARHNDFSDLVALKLLKQETKDPEMLARTRREIEIGLELNHPNVVKLFGFGTYLGSPYIVTEFVPGRSLEEVLSREGAFPLGRACHVIEQLASGLEHAHSKGVVHRDLKPGNLFLSEQDQVKILDFGLARILESEQKLTKTGQALGTPIYMSPEQIRGKAGVASDYYSVGIIFFEMLTGRPPFHGTNAMQILSSHTFTVPPALTEMKPEIPREISDLVAALLLKRPEKRLQDPDVIIQTVAAYRSDYSHGLLE